LKIWNLYSHSAAMPKIIIKLKTPSRMEYEELKKENEELKKKLEKLEERLIDAQTKLNDSEDYQHFVLTYPDHVKCEKCNCCVDCECCECDILSQ